MKPDLYTPWRDSPTSLRARHVGRKAELRQLLASAGRFAGGAQPVHTYIYGPRGVGKSHLLALLAAELRPRLRDAGVAIVQVSEDIPAFRTAADLLQRLEETAQGPGWKRWQRTRPAQPLGRTLVLFEGLDRQLNALGKLERRNLRRALEDRPYLLIATGVTLTPDLSRRSEAFYGAFDVYPLEALDEASAAELLRKQLGVERLGAREQSILTLAGGSPRALLAMADAYAAAPDGWAADDLYRVIRDFTAHYQLRFRDLAPQAQHIVELLAEAPREMAPGETGEVLGLSTTQASTVLNRLLKDGVVSKRSEGRRSHYRLAEPLFRYWLEYRTSPWEETRVRWLGHLLQALLEPEDIGSMWREHRDVDLRAAAGSVLAEDHGAFGAAFDAEVQAPTAEGFDRLCALNLSWAAAHSFVLSIGSTRIPATLIEAFEQHHHAFALALRIRGGHRPREALRELLNTPFEHDSRFILASLVVSFGGRGRPWRLSSAERHRAARLPWFRAVWLNHGKAVEHPPLINEREVLEALGPETPMDWNGLLQTASIEALEDLFAHVVRQAKVMVKCRTPVRGAPSVPDAVADWIQRSEPSPWALSWAATAAEMGAHKLEPVAQALGRVEFEKHSPEAELALTSLAVRSPERFELLAEHLQAGWQPALERARLLRAQIAEGAHGKLHPELARLAEAIPA